MRGRNGLNRRSFLKASGIAALGAALEGKSGAATNQANAASTLGGDPLDLVNVLQGTRSTRVFSRGNTLPIAAAPFGMAHWTLQSESGTAWMFRPDNRRLQGLRCTHQLSPWLSDYGEAVFLPICGVPNTQPEMRASSWRPEDSQLRPYSFRLNLLRYQAEIELIPTERCSLITAQISGPDAPGFLVEVPHSGEAIQMGADKRTLRFRSRMNEGGVPKNFATYYVVRFGAPWERCDVTAERGGQVAVAQFAMGQPVEARIATSFISFEQAERNLHLELGTKTADEVRSETKARWTEYFNRIQIDGGSDRERATFYSCLYRALLFPRIFHEPDSDGKPQHFSAFNGKVMPGVMYADHGYWDVYRAWYPLMSIVYPDRLAEILQAWTNSYREGGWLPQFPAPGYRACMTGSLIDAVFGDAAVKGIKGFDLATAYEGLKKHATQPGNPDAGYGRRGIGDYLKLGYVAADHVEQSVAETADSAYGDFCIAQVAKALGKNEDAAMFLDRSRNWRKIFDAGTGFLRGKLANGAWLEPFDEFQWGSPYVEGSAWQHRWDVMQDIPGLIEAMGGNERAVANLDKMMATPPIFHVGIYGQEIHEMSEMAAVNFGQYGQNNQPSHHLLYIYAVAGRPDRTQYWVRRAMNELFSPDSYPGDEDTGSMGAWYILSAMGFYSLTPGKAEYVTGSPLFDRVTLRMPDGKVTEIEARGQSAKNVYVGKLLVDGEEHNSPILEHSILTRGARLTFSMQEKPAS